MHGELRQAHFTAGVAVRENVLRIMEGLHRGIHVDVLPRERGNHSTHEPQIQPLFQAKWNVEAYIDEFKDLVDLSGYTDPIAIVLKFR
jgi:hypothetical protein